MIPRRAQPTLTFVRALFGDAMQDKLLFFIVGAMLGSVANILPTIVLGLGTILSLVRFSWLAFDRVQSAKVAAVSHLAAEAIKRADEHALGVSRKANEAYLVVGKNIEILAHPNLNTMASFRSLGWDVGEVGARNLHQGREFSQLLDCVGGLREFEKPNGLKYGLATRPFITLDAPIPHFDFYTTDYFTIRSVMEHLKDDPHLRYEFSDPDPARHGIPHSVALQYIVRFVDGDLLCLRRDERTAYQAGRWSFSGEEQLNESDFAHDSPIEALFKRALCEEVFAFRDDNPGTLSRRWDKISQHVEIMRLWSVFLEEYVGHFQIFGVCQLNTTAEQYFREYEGLVEKGLSRDIEGKLYTVSPSEAEALLVNGSCHVREFFRPVTAKLEDQNLHETARYRLWRLSLALNRSHALA